MKRLNRYESLRLVADERPHAEPVEARASSDIGTPDELISIATAVTTDGLWTYGYIVHWHLQEGQTKQRVSRLDPAACNGLFCSQREARLYAVGFMLSYTEYFLPDTVDALRREEGRLRQMQLF